MTAECAVASSSVVVLEPRCKCCGAIRVRGVRTAVCPFGGESAIESFDFAVLPGTMRLDELLHNLVFGTHRAERVSICPRVVGHQSFDPIDAVHSEVGDSASEESRTCDTFLVIMNSEYAKREWSSTIEWT